MSYESATEEPVPSLRTSPRRKKGITARTMRRPFAVAGCCLVTLVAKTKVAAWGVRPLVPRPLVIVPVLHRDHHNGADPTRRGCSQQRGFHPQHYRTYDTSQSALSSTTTTASSSSSSVVEASTVVVAEPPSPPLSTSASEPIPSMYTSTPPSPQATTVDVNIPDVKDCVKLFGRLADKYLLLDASAGMCCYSGCSDCEYRLPGGGYKMADQRSARPKWIPVYAQRTGASPTNVHQSKWSTSLFGRGDGNEKSSKRGLTKDEFSEIVRALPYETPLGGPSVSKSDAIDVSEHAVEKLWCVLSRGKDRLTEKRMSTALQRLAFGGGGTGGTPTVEGGGSDAGTSGVAWKQFVAALQSTSSSDA